MRNLVEIELGEEAKSHILSLLEKRGLTHTVFNSIGDWVFTAIAPNGTPNNRLRKFDVGGLCSTSDSKKTLVRVIEKELETLASAAFIVEDILANPEDIWNESPDGVDANIVDGSVVYSVQLQPGHANLISEVYKCPLSFDTVSLLVRDKIDFRDKDKISQNTILVAATSYDQESFIIARPASVARIDAS